MALYDALFDFWMRFNEKIRYLLVGGFNTVVYYMIFAVLTLYFGEQYGQFMLFVAFILCSFVSFFTQKVFVFNTVGDVLKEYPKCLLTWAIGYAINAALLWGCVHFLGINVYVGEVISLATSTVVTYILLKHFAFQRSVRYEHV